MNFSESSKKKWDLESYLRKICSILSQVINLIIYILIIIKLNGIYLW